MCEQAVVLLMGLIKMFWSLDAIIFVVLEITLIQPVL